MTYLTIFLFSLTYLTSILVSPSFCVERLENEYVSVLLKHVDQPVQNTRGLLWISGYIKSQELTSTEQVLGLLNGMKSDFYPEVGELKFEDKLNLAKHKYNWQADRETLRELQTIIWTLFPNKTVCELKYLIKLVSLMESILGSKLATGNATIPLVYAIPATEHRLIYQSLIHKTNQYLELCDNNIEFEYNFYINHSDRLAEQKLDSLFSKLSEHDNAIAPRLAVVAAIIDSLDDSTVVAKIGEILDDDSTTDPIGHYINSVCRPLVKNLELSLGMYTLAHAIDPVIAVSLDSITETQTFQKLQEYNRLCYKALAGRRINGKN